MTRLDPALAGAALPIIAAASQGTPEGDRDVQALAEDLDPATAAAVVALYARVLGDLGRRLGEDESVVRPVVQAALLHVHAAPPAP